MNININHARLMRNLMNLGKIGENKNGGVDRALGSAADEEARNWLKSYWTEHMGLEAETDAAANLWLTWKTGQKTRPIAIGSHHDAVPDGGKYDGALGVLLATEIMETLMEARVQMRHPLTVVSFTGEEPNPYNVSTLGSKVVSGRLDRAALEPVKSRDTGETMKSTICRLGGSLERLETARLSAEDYAAFLECHIEQGHRLEDMGLAIAAVTCITGIYREEIRVKGEANHAGTTCMGDRKDAFLGAAEFALGLEAIVKQYEGIVATSGYVKVIPGEANIIPGETVMIIDIRTCREDLLEKVLRQMDEMTGRLQEKRRIQFCRNVILDQKPVPMAEPVVRAVESGCLAIGEPTVRLESMAGHDAANMARVTESGMIFVRSVGGKSHCREEYTTPEDIEKVGNAMLAAVLELDRKLDQKLD